MILTPELLRARLDAFYAEPPAPVWVRCLCGLRFPDKRLLARHMLRVRLSPKLKIHKAHGERP